MAVRERGIPDPFHGGKKSERFQASLGKGPFVFCVISIRRCGFIATSNPIGTNDRIATAVADLAK
jgi:hypothetical protein